MEKISGYLSANYNDSTRVSFLKNQKNAIPPENGKRIVITDISINVNGVHIDNAVTLKRNDQNGDVLWSWTGDVFNDIGAEGEFPVVGELDEGIYIDIANGTDDMNVGITYFYLTLPV